MKKLKAGIFVFILAGVFSCSPAPDFSVPEGPARDAVDFDFDIATLDGENAVLSRMLESGGKVLLVFWTTRCALCVRGVPELNDFYDKHGDRVEFLSVNVGESRERIESFAASAGVKYPVGLDKDAYVARQFGIPGVPAYILLGPGGEYLYSGFSFEEAAGRALL